MCEYYQQWLNVLRNDHTPRLHFIPTVIDGLSSGVVFFRWIKTSAGEQLCQSGVRIASKFHINIPSGRPMATVNANLIGPHNSIQFSIQFDWRGTITNEPHLTCPDVGCKMSLSALESAFPGQQMAVVGEVQQSHEGNLYTPQSFPTSEPPHIQNIWGKAALTLQRSTRDFVRCSTVSFINAVIQSSLSTHSFKQSLKLEWIHLLATDATESLDWHIFSKVSTTTLLSSPWTYEGKRHSFTTNSDNVWFKKANVLFC